MYDLLSIGNISVDFYYQGNSLTRKGNRFFLAVGGKYFVDRFYEGVGGGGANVAIGVRRNGFKTAVLGKIGRNEFKIIILNKLKKAGVDSVLCQEEDNYFNISSILLTESGERTVINFDTPGQSLFEDKKNISRLLEAKSVYFGNLPDVSLTERIEIIKLLRKKNILTFVNLGVSDCQRPVDQICQFLKYTDILILNSHEFSELIKKPYEEIVFKKNVLKNIDCLKNKLVIITDGEKGSYGYLDNQVFFEKAFKLESIVDTTGAGDAYTSGFISEYLKSKDIKKSMSKGSSYALKILSKIGAN